MDQLHGEEKVREVFQCKTFFWEGGNAQRWLGTVGRAVTPERADKPLAEEKKLDYREVKTYPNRRGSLSTVRCGKNFRNQAYYIFFFNIFLEFPTLPTLLTLLLERKEDGMEGGKEGSVP